MNIVRIVINAAEPLLLKTPVILCPRSCCICWKTVLTQKLPLKQEWRICMLQTVL